MDASRFLEKANSEKDSWEVLIKNDHRDVSISTLVEEITMSAFGMAPEDFDWSAILQRTKASVRQRSRGPKLLSRHIQSVGNKKRRDSPANAANNWVPRSGYAQF